MEVGEIWAYSIFLPLRNYSVTIFLTLSLCNTFTVTSILQENRIRGSPTFTSIYSLPAIMPPRRSLPFALTLLTVLLPPASTSTIPSLFSMPYHTIFTRQVSNLQTFTGSLGGAAPPITQSDDSSRPFEVGGSTFTDFKSAAQRTCDNQFTTCASQANAEQNKGGFTVTDCSNQKSTASPSILAISYFPFPT